MTCGEVSLPRQPCLAQVLGLRTRPGYQAGGDTDQCSARLGLSKNKSNLGMGLISTSRSLPPCTCNKGLCPAEEHKRRVREEKMLQCAPWAWWLQRGDFCVTPVWGAGAGQGVLPHPQLCRFPRHQPWGRTGSKVMDHWRTPACLGQWSLAAGGRAKRCADGTRVLSPLSRAGEVESCQEVVEFLARSCLFTWLKSLLEGLLLSLTAVHVGLMASSAAGNGIFLVRSLLV